MTKTIHRKPLSDQEKGRLLAWVDALESGKYKQETRYLKRKHRTDDGMGHCCLGVLCELYNEMNPDQKYHWEEPWPSGQAHADGAMMLSTPDVNHQWSGTPPRRILNYFRVPETFGVELASTNDSTANKDIESGNDYASVIRVIKKNLLGMEV